MKKLMDNYFTVQYAEPNLIFISWQNIPRKQVNKNPFKVTAENYLNPNNMLTLHDYKKKEENSNEAFQKQDIFKEIDQEFIRDSSNVNRYIQKNIVFPNMSDNIKNNNSIYNNSSNNNLTNYNSNNNTQNSFNNKQIVLNKLVEIIRPLNLNDVNNYNNNYNSNYNNNYNSNYNDNNSNNFNKEFSFNNNFPTCKTNDNNLQNFNSDIDTILNELDINDGNANNTHSSSNNDDSFIGTLL